MREKGAAGSAASGAALPRNAPHGPSPVPQPPLRPPLASTAWAAWAALAAAVGALAVRYALAGGVSLTYNEATYVELGTHPWWSAYYPDALFVRHPPLMPLVLGAWGVLFGTGEWSMRLPGLLACAGGVALLWHAVRRRSGDGAAAVAALVLGLSFPLHVYGLQASMYPFAFLFAAAMLAARTRRTQAAALALLCLTHLFGFLVAALWLWRARADLRARPADAWPLAAPALWLPAAVVGALLLNPEGDIMRLGPLGQFLRGGATAGEAVGDGFLVHLAAGALMVFFLGPALLARALRTRPGAWGLALPLFLAYFFLGAPFPRYALVPLPAAVHAGTEGLDVRRAVLAVALAALTVPLGLLYLHEGPDPRARGDVPGQLEWRDAVAKVAPLAAALDVGPDGAGAGGADGTLVVATSGPTATAYYLEERGWRVVGREQAPYDIRLDGPYPVRVLRVDSAQAAEAAPGADVWILPDDWHARPGVPCGGARGLVVRAVACPA